ncbi:MAG: Endoribonuclease EndoA [Firmicutes bacterium]|nr:Endoribonuclease EndoA [Bacillota bacterium]
MNIKRGDIFYADLSPVVGSEQGGVRPVLIVQNDVGNKYSPTVVIAAITSQIDKARLPTHVELSSTRLPT